MKLVFILLIFCSMQAHGQSRPSYKYWPKANIDTTLKLVSDILDDQIRWLINRPSYVIIGGDNYSISLPAAKRQSGHWTVNNDTLALEIMFNIIERQNKELDSLRNNQCCSIMTQRWKPGTQHLIIFDGRDTFRFSPIENILIKTHK